MKTRNEIMKQAHEIAKTLEGNYTARLSEALKMAWAESRNQTSLVEKAKAKLQEISEKYNCFESFKKSSYSQKVNIWENYGKARLYIPRNAYESAGYIDLLSGTIHPTRPGNYNTLEEVLKSL